ncbi:MAG TPA: heavy metal-binding domain-containing protein [Segetibacter sp.]|jgi:uncharacterized protein with PIN domain
MKPLKFLMIAVLSIFFISSANAQTSKSKKTKAKTTTAAVKYQCPMKCEGDKTYAKPGKCPVCNMALSKVQKETAAYKCPMKCEGDKTYAKAGKCPVCNMNLAKVDAKKATTGHEGHNHN